MELKKLLLLTFSFLLVLPLLFSFAQASCNGATYVFWPGDTVNESCFFNESVTYSGVFGYTIDTNSVQVDCANFDFIGDNSTNTPAFLIASSTEAAEIKNCHIIDWGYGVYVSSGNLTRISDTNFTHVLNTAISEHSNGWTQAWRTRIDCTNYSAYGIDIRETGYAQLANNTISNCAYGIILSDDSNEVYGNNITDANLTAIFLNTSSLNTVSENRIYKTGAITNEKDMYGIYNYNSTDNTFTNNYITNYSNTADDEGDMCFYNNASNVTNVSSNIFHECYNGYYNEYGTDNQVEHNRINTTTRYNDTDAETTHGLYSIYGNTNVFWNNTIYYASDGINVYGETDDQISKNYIYNGIYTPYGIWASYNNNLIIVNNIIVNNTDDSSVGINLITSNNTNISGNRITDSDVLIFSIGSYNTVGLNNNLTGESSLNILSVYSNITFLNTRTDEATLPYLKLENVTFVDYSGTIPSLNDWSNIGIAYNITNLTENANVYLNITYPTASVTNESNLGMWKYNGSWYNVTTGGVNTASNYVYSGNVTSFSIFAPLEHITTDTDLDSGTCGIFLFILIISCIALLCSVAGFAYSLYVGTINGEEMGSQEMLTKLLGTAIGAIVSIAFIIYIADQYTAMCLI